MCTQRSPISHKIICQCVFEDLLLKRSLIWKIQEKSRWEKNWSTLCFITLVCHIVPVTHFVSLEWFMLQRWVQQWLLLFQKFIFNYMVFFSFSETLCIKRSNKNLGGNLGLSVSALFILLCSLLFLVLYHPIYSSMPIFIMTIHHLIILYCWF